MAVSRLFTEFGHLSEADLVTRQNGGVALRAAWGRGRGGRRTAAGGAVRDGGKRCGVRMVGILWECMAPRRLEQVCTGSVPVTGPFLHPPRGSVPDMDVDLYM
jgi:hypothetical protein